MKLKRISALQGHPAAGLLTARAASSVAVGMVVGAGLFKSPALVAANVGSDGALFAAWLLGGLLDEHRFSGSRR